MDAAAQLWPNDGGNPPYTFWPNPKCSVKMKVRADNTVYIGDIWVQPDAREQGIGGVVLNLVCNLADKYEVELTLIPATSTSNHKQQLIKWYKKHRFQTMGRYMMFRMPILAAQPKEETISCINQPNVV